MKVKLLTWIILYAFIHMLRMLYFILLLLLLLIAQDSPFTDIKTDRLKTVFDLIYIYHQKCYAHRSTFTVLPIALNFTVQKCTFQILTLFAETDGIDVECEC